MSEYAVTRTEEVSVTDLSTNDAVPPDLNIRDIGAALGLKQARMKLWYFDPGEEIQYHAHREQEEIYYVIQGQFSLKLGRSGEEEYVEVGPGDFYAARPEIGHGHRYLGEDEGILLAIGVPSVDDPGLDPHSLDD